MASFYSPYIGTSEIEREVMMEELGMNDILDLFCDLPPEIILKDTLTLPGPYSEAELGRLFKCIAKKNITPNSSLSFLGGGVRQQYIPAAIEELMRRGELYTAYTPYQPEVSQGMLQLLYEYQCLMAELLAMDVVNSSMYDWGSAMGESIRIMHRIRKKKKILVVEPISPNRMAVTESYVKHSDIELVVIRGVNGNIDADKIEHIMQTEVDLPKKERQYAGIYFEVPSYYGTLPPNPEKITELAHKAGMLVTVGVDPISLGIVRPPGEYDADFVVGEGQLLGNAPSTGGPLLGILASKYDKKWIRQVPGRLVGETNELISDTKGYCITLVTREQHIRREKATSNICSNQAITAVNAAIYLASLGRHGIIELAQSLMDRAHYLASNLDKLPGIKSPKFDQPYFCEFVVQFDNITHEELEAYCDEHAIIPGIPVGDEGCDRLIAVSELHTREDLDRFVSIMELRS